MANDMVNSFLDGISDETGSGSRNEKRRHKKNRYGDIENGFLTVGGGKPVEETDVDINAGIPGRPTGTENNRTADQHEQSKKRQEHDKQGTDDHGIRREGPKNAPQGDLIRKADDLLRGQAKILEAIDLLKSQINKGELYGKLDGISEELKNISFISPAPQPKDVPQAESDDIMPSPAPAIEDKTVTDEKYEQLLQEKEASDLFAEKARKTVESLAQEISEKDEKIAELNEEVARLSAENQKMRAAIAAKLAQRKAASNVQAVPLRPAPPVGYDARQPATPLEQPQARVVGQEYGNTNVWGDQAPPSVDLMPDEEKPKKGLFHRK